MNIIINILLNIIFYSEILTAVITLITIKNKLSKPFLLHAATALAAIAPYYLIINYKISMESIIRLSDAGLLVVPLTLAIFIKYQFLYIKKKNFIILYILTGIGILTYISFWNYRETVLYLIHILYWMFLIYYTCYKQPSIYAKAYIALFFCHLVYIILVMIKTDYTITYLVVSNGIISISIFIISIIDYINRIIEVSRRFQKMYDLNKKLSHTVSRLTTSNERIKKIIHQKDLELLQLSRHASLAKITTGIAHEISQPLTGIKGIAQNMIDDINYEEFDNLQAVAELHKISTLVDKSSHIIDHIRNFSKKNIFIMKNIDLNETVLDAIDLIKNQLKNNDIELLFVLDDKLPKINGNKISLEQLIVNLIINARDSIIEKYQTSTSFSGQIRISTSHDNNKVLLIIEDNGTGIPENIIQKIWSPFFTTKTSGQGTGIGLSICHRIAHEHNALINIKTSNDGTSFIIAFTTQINQDEKYS